MTHEELVRAVEEIELHIQPGDDQKIDRVKQILNERDEAQDSDLYCRLALAMCRYQDNKHPNEVFTYAEIAAQLARRCDSKILLAKSLRYLGTSGAMLGDYMSTLENLSESLRIFAELEDNSGVALVLNSLGNVNSMLGDYPQALEYYQKALAIDQNLGNKKTMAGTISNIGVINFNLADYPQALEYFQQALTINEELGNKLWAANNLGNIGNVYYHLSEHDRSLEYLLKAYALHSELDNDNGMAAILSSLGTMYSQMEDYPRALEYFHRGLSIEEKHGHKLGIARNTGNIGDIYATPDSELFNPQKAEEYLLKAIQILSDIGSKHEQTIYHRYLALLYKRVGRWRDSLEQYEKFHELFAEVQSEESIRKAQQFEHRRKIEESERDRQIKLARFQEQEKILHNILPAQIAERMVAGEKMIAESHEYVSVFFSDIVGFTKISQKVSAEELVGMLNGIFTQFDQLARKHGLEKIKTIGDSYMAVAGAPVSQENHAERAALFALDTMELMKNHRTNSGEKIEVRIGLHSGAVVAGVIGESKFAYDLWGDAVNTAARMESHGEAGRIHCSEEFVKSVGLMIDDGGLKSENPQSQILNHQFAFSTRGEMDIKGKGMMRTYFLERAE